MVFQDPMTSLDPASRSAIRWRRRIRGAPRRRQIGAKERAIALLDEVGIPAAKERYGDPPHRLSGGMRQRVVIAAALANEPALLLADEPTTALDVTIQAQVLDLLRHLRERHGTTIVLITHDLGVVAQIVRPRRRHVCGAAGRGGAGARIFASPRHPYTRALLEALPSAHHERGSLRVMDGSVPDLADPPAGLPFRPRCPLVECDVPAARHEPPLTVACWLASHTRWCWHARARSQSRVTSHTSRRHERSILEALGVSKEFTIGGDLLSRHRKLVRGGRRRPGVAAGEMLALVGESGSGKSTLGRCCSA